MNESQRCLLALRMIDQVANIKRKLQLMLTGCQIFLDVDNLDDTGDLEQYVRRLLATHP